MIKYIGAFLSLFLWSSCGTTKKETVSDQETKQEQQEAAVEKEIKATAANYARTISVKELKDYLYTFASDEFEGRDTGEPGQKKAAAFLKENYQRMGIPSPISDDNYYQTIPETYFIGGIKASENVLAFIEAVSYTHLTLPTIYSV